MSTATLAPSATAAGPCINNRHARLGIRVKSSCESRSELALPAMQRLPFTLPDFTRISWASDAAREVWEGRIHRISNAWMEIEWLAVAAGIRACCITNVMPDQFIERAARWAEQGLTTLPMIMVGSGTTYSSTTRTVEQGKPFAFRCVLGSAKDVTTFRKAWDSSDDRAMGKLLGYPDCCREFFKRVWVDAGSVDTTWPMAVASTSADVADTLVELSGPPKANILWRWMGVRAVSHLPCSFACDATIELADRFIELGRRQGYDEEMDWLLQILDWPVEWSALHGIAEIKTPILKVSTRTDATPCKYTVRYKGHSIPREAVRGLRFPFITPSSPVVTESEGFKRGLQNPIVEQPCRASWYAADNGFSCVAAMDRAHEPVLKAANVVLAQNPGMVLDLGCGNGALLKKLLDANPSIIPFGIDIEASRIAHAHGLLPTFTDNLVAGDLFDTESVWVEGRRYGMALLMPGRLLEVTPDKAARLRSRLQAQCDRILIYTYGDYWLARHGSLEVLAKAAGLEVVDVGKDSIVGFARIAGSEHRVIADSKPTELPS